MILVDTSVLIDFLKLSLQKGCASFFNLRRQGLTIRNTIDVLIARIAIEHDLFLLHNDRDFDAISEKNADLKILNNVI